MTYHLWDVGTRFYYGEFDDEAAVMALGRSSSATMAMPTPMSSYSSWATAATTISPAPRSSNERVRRTRRDRSLHPGVALSRFMPRMMLDQPRAHHGPDTPPR